ncbi:Uncharacterised protein [Vibrio cholerae]|nr:Uncharacterised protein [Vibrio cholerae]
MLILTITPKQTRIILQTFPKLISKPTNHSITQQHPNDLE